MLSTSSEMSGHLVESSRVFEEKIFWQKRESCVKSRRMSVVDDAHLYFP